MVRSGRCGVCARSRRAIEGRSSGSLAAVIQRFDALGSPAPRRREPARFPWGGLAMFAVALLVRALYAWLTYGANAAPSSDATTYDTIAWNLAHGVGFQLDGGGGHYPTAFVPPVVPWLTSLLYRVAGHRFFAAILLQCAIGACVPLLLASFASATFGGNVGRLAGWLAAFDPLLVFFSGYLLTETTFTAALLIALAASAEWVKTPRPGRAFGAGLLWGLAALTRPTALPLPLLIAGWAWVPLGLTLAGRDRVRQVALLFLGLAVVVAPWTMRNAVALRAFVPITTGGGRALLDANNARVWDDPVQRGGATSVYHLEPWASELRGLSEPQADARAGQLAREFLLGRVAQWPAMAVHKLARFWRLTAEGGRTGAWQSAGTPIQRLRSVVDPLLLWSLFLLPLALWGVVRVLQGQRRLFQSLGLFVIGAFSLGAVVYWGALRMRVPIEPLVVLYAAAGFEDLRLRMRARGRGLRVIEGARSAS